MKTWLVTLSSVLGLGALSFIVWQMYVETAEHHLLGLTAHIIGLVAIVVLILSSVQIALILRPAHLEERVRDPRSHKDRLHAQLFRDPGSR